MKNKLYKLFEPKSLIFTVFLTSIILLINVLALKYYLLTISFLSLSYLIYTRIKFSHEHNIKLILSLIVYISSIIYMLFILPYFVILILGSISIGLFSYFRIKSIDSLSKKAYIGFSSFLIILFSFILIIQLYSSSIFPSHASFTTYRAEQEARFSKFDLRDSDQFMEESFEGWNEEDQTWRSLIFLSVQTDLNYFTLEHNNFNQANFSVFVNITESMPDSNSKFWNTTINLRVIAWDTFVKHRIQEEGVSSYELLDLIDEIHHSSEFYNTSKGNTNASVTANKVRMGTYLVCIDILIEPIEENRILYEFFDSPMFSAPISYNVTGDLNFGLEADREGYAYVVNYLMPRASAENFFDDLIGYDIWNLIILFMILFLVSVILSMTLKDIQILKINLILLTILWVIGLFAVVSTGMENTPNWLKNIFPNSDAMYLWAVIEAVKYAIVMGAVLGIIFVITTYISTSFNSIFVQSE